MVADTNTLELLRESVGIPLSINRNKSDSRYTIKGYFRPDFVCKIKEPLSLKERKKPAILGSSEPEVVQFDHELDTNEPKVVQFEPELSSNEPEVVQFEPSSGLNDPKWFSLNQFLVQVT
ncbi:hypothetical protein C2G38_2154478 [Gigaspora rosea]|uniref:Uncharacterized protein n=1 Tax=Gigaspora rosea TaxID=44941 RepID=A0A397W8A7_9GLOM|nr:hypothetical protein C2G38_2154478 [Gigaspora rosea]